MKEKQFQTSQDLTNTEFEELRERCLSMAVNSIPRPRNYDEDTLLEYVHATVTVAGIFTQFITGTLSQDEPEQE